MFVSVRVCNFAKPTLRSLQRWTSTKLVREHFISHPWRSFFYVPGDRLKLIEKIAKLPKTVSSENYTSHVPDLVVLDCEDAVAHDRKLDARETVSNSFSSYNGELFRSIREDLRRLVMVRINPTDTEFSEGDVRQVLESALTTASDRNGYWPGPDVFCLPKVTSIDQLSWLSSTVDGLLSQVYNNLPFKRPTIGLVAFIESCSAVVGLHSLCDASHKLQVPLVGLVFGSDDYCVSMGVERSARNHELTYARQYIPVIAKAYNLSVIDMVDIDYKDMESLRDNCEHGVQLGYRGKQTIHPSQLPIVNQSFSPSPSRVEWCKELLAEAKRQSDNSDGITGAFAFKGRMIDRPTLLQAEHVVKQANIMNI